MTTSQSLSNNLPEHPSIQLVNGFDYEKLNPGIRIVVQQRTSEIQNLMRRTNQQIIEIGQKLTEVKAQLGHGNFGIWLKAEFDWSVRTANRFMQVAESFKLVTVTNLDITASALYFLASASTPQEARAEAILRATNGEKINYTLVKKILSQHKKNKNGAVELEAALLKSDEPLNVIEPIGDETTFTISTQEDLTKEQAQTETQSLLLQESKPDVVFENKQIITTIKDIPDNTTQTLTSMENLVAISYETSDASIEKMAISIIKNLTPEQLARVIILAANTGLSEYQLSAIIMASQQVLNTLKIL